MSSLVHLTRTCQFSAAHRYRRLEWSDEENRRIFGKCSNPNGHGHDYTCEVTVAGELDSRTGMVLNITELKSAMNRVIVAPCDGKFINLDHPAFVEMIPTSENLVLNFREQLYSAVAPTQLRSIRLSESRDFWIEWKAQVSGMLLTRTYDFCAGHRLWLSSLSADENKRLYGKCENPHGHGHNYLLEVTLRGAPDPQTGMVVNFDELDPVVAREVVERYDHKFLNSDVEDFADCVPTSENMCRVIWQRLDSALTASGVKAQLHRVGLRETPKNFFEYFGDNGDTGQGNRS